MVDNKNNNYCLGVGKDSAQGNIANNDVVQLFPVSLLPEFTDEDLFEATGTEKPNDVPDVNNLESSASSSATPSALGIIQIPILKSIIYFHVILFQWILLGQVE